MTFSNQEKQAKLRQVRKEVWQKIEEAGGVQEFIAKAKKDSESK